jgi:hypothetical protein
LADNYTRAGQSFRSEDKSSVQFPVLLVGAHVRTYVGVQTLVLTSSSQALTVPALAEFADIYCEGSSSLAVARFWHNGQVPTSSAGIRLKDHEVIQSADPSTFRAINETGTCTLRVEYYRYI